MIKLSIAFIFLLLTTNINAQEKQWFQHGELYKYKMNKWKESSILDKLSFSANYITAFMPNMTKTIKQSSNSMELLKFSSLQLSICIDEMYQKSPKIMSKSDITDVADICKMMMKVD